MFNMTYIDILHLFSRFPVGMFCWSVLLQELGEMLRTCLEFGLRILESLLYIVYTTCTIHINNHQFVCCCILL